MSLENLKLGLSLIIWYDQRGVLIMTVTLGMVSIVEVPIRL